MKVGVENKKELMVMAVLLAVAIPLLLYNFRDQIFGSASAANVPLPAIASSASKGPAAIGARDNDPRLRLDILEASRRVKYEAGGRNIFRMEEKKIDPVKVAVRLAPIGPPQDPTPTPPPPPPPIPIIYSVTPASPESQSESSCRNRARATSSLPAREISWPGVTGLSRFCPIQ